MLALASVAAGARADAGLQNWWSFAPSANGTRLVALTHPAPKYPDPVPSHPGPPVTPKIFRSADSGASWAEVAGQPTLGSDGQPLDWLNIASSADGTRLVATARRDHIYVSSDAGATWVRGVQTTVGMEGNGIRNGRVSSGDWNGLVSSAANDGTLVALGNEAAWVSDDSGVSWARHDSGLRPSESWLTARMSGVAASRDCRTLVAISSDRDARSNYLYTSADSGRSWSRADAPGADQWSAVASSADGATLVASSNIYGTGAIFTSSDSGATWARRTATKRGWYGVASSADGAFLVAVEGRRRDGDGGYLYTSTDAGASWAARTTQRVAWESVACSADCGTIVGTVSTDTHRAYMWRSTDSGATWQQGPLRLPAPSTAWCAGAYVLAVGAGLLAAGLCAQGLRAAARRRAAGLLDKPGPELGGDGELPDVHDAL